MKKKKLLISVIVAEIVIILAAAGLILWMSMPKETQQAENLSDYTWEEFSALSDQEKLAFSQKFEGDDFEKWLGEVKPQETTPEETMPWEQGGKQPDAYTWEEYEALTPGQQMGFFNWFDSVEAFDAWMNRAKPQETEPESLPEGAMPWERGGKQPDAYPWEEYQGLTADEQMAFFYWFASVEDFDAWMNRVNPQETEPESESEGAMPWEQGGKQPDAYTWEEYEALTAEQQMKFFYWFDSVEDFDAWMKKAQNP